jgi:hyaluronate lyase
VALVKSLSGVTPAPERDGHTLFASMDRSVHRRSGWAYSISMASRRIAYYECGNGENELGYHTGSGMTYLYDRDNGQYADAFWPTVDRTRLPGTTVDKLPLPPKAGGEWAATRPTTAWVGGSTLAGYAAVGQDLQGLLSPMRARKSWFCLDEYVVALGAGITGSSGYPVETVIENRNLHSSGTNGLTVDGLNRVPALGDSATVSNARWAHLDGVGGYIFPSGSTLQLRREERTGSWHDINTGGPTTPITRRYLTMWQDHGVNPSGSTYSYLVAPGASAARTEQLSKASGLLVLRNTAAVQAVSSVSLATTLVNFWQPGRVGDLQVDTPCSVIARLRGHKVELAVSDPTQLATTIHLTVMGTKVTVDVSGAAGATRYLTISI